MIDLRRQNRTDACRAAHRKSNNIVTFRQATRYLS
jgi:hypothetical protein